MLGKKFGKILTAINLPISSFFDNLRVAQQPSAVQQPV